MSQNTPFVILAAADFSAHSQRALAVAKEHALRTPFAELHVVHVVPPPIASVSALGSSDMAATFTETLDRTRVELARECGEIAKGLEDRVYGHVRTGTPGREIAEVAKEIGADLIVVGTHGRTGLSRVLLGSVAEEVVRHAACDVLTVRLVQALPAIEPACAECTTAQNAGGPKARCARHTRRAVHPHTYSDNREGLLHQTFRFD